MIYKFVPNIKSRWNSGLKGKQLFYFSVSKGNIGIGNVNKKSNNFEKFRLRNLSREFFFFFFQIIISSIYLPAFLSFFIFFFLTSRLIFLHLFIRSCIIDNFTIKIAYFSGHGELTNSARPRKNNEIIPGSGPGSGRKFHSISARHLGQNLSRVALIHRGRAARW